MPLTQLPGMLGPFDRVNIHAEYWFRTGWVLTLRHKHDREAYNCVHVIRLEGLSHQEMGTAIEAFLDTGRGRFTWLSEEVRCASDCSA